MTEAYIYLLLTFFLLEYPTAAEFRTQKKVHLSFKKKIVMKIVQIWRGKSAWSSR